MATRNIVKDRIVGGSYHDISGFRNTFFSTVLAITDYYNSFFFDGDENRVIYSSTDHAFRRRIQTQKKSEDNGLTINALNFPFMSFAIRPGGITPNVDRSSWKNFPLELEGVMDWTIKKKLRMSPVRIDFEATYFTDKTLDLHYIMSEVMWDDAMETKIRPQLEIDGEVFDNIGILAYGLSYADQYNENDWLEQNKIRAITLDVSVDTFLVKDQNSSFGIPQSVIFEFAYNNNLDVDFYDPDEVYNGVIDHIEEEVRF